ncbi:MAG: type VI secretion system baseplate subunit TssF [Burkholderiaceae bacterium]|jgi:type VI secretion system protein ImpG|nr:type VI secretion system baseplate subunit TssF [Burkholderiaceae bacterium]
MDPRLLDLYEQELRYFRESSGEFALAYPKIAARLGIDGPEVADPYVERLIEATAFLSARVVLKLDAEYPRFTGHLLDIVYPHFLAPTPSMAVLAFEPDLQDGKLAAGVTLPRGSTLRARQAAGQNTHCEMRSAAALRLWPIQLTRAQYFSYAPDLPLASHPRVKDIRGGLRITLRTAAGLNFAQIALDELVLHFGGAPDVAWQLHECALGNPVGALVLPAGRSEQVRRLPASALQAMGFEDDEALLPQTATGFSGFRLMQEYFAFPERFQFVRLTGLAPLLAQMPVAEIEIVLLFSRGDAALEKLVGAGNVLLHCVPAINLFAKRLDRVSVTEGVGEFHLVPDRTRPMDFEVHSVTGVTGHGAPAPGAAGEGARKQRFLPFYSAFHDARHAHPAYYTTTREPRVLSQHQRREGARSSHVGSELYLQLVDAQQAPFAGSLRQLSVSALCSNRDLLLLPLGRENDFECADSVPVRRVRTVRGPSRPVSPVVAQGLGWRVLDHLALNHLSLADSAPAEGAAALRELLTLYATHADAARLAQVRGLLSVRTRALTRRLPLAGPIAFGRGLEVRLEIDRNAFHGHSAFLFGAVLAQFLARHVEMNHFVETVLVAAGQGEIMRWRPLCGTRPIL